MRKVKFDFVCYKNSDTVECKGKREKIQMYLNNGYHLKKDNDTYMLVKYPLAIVRIKDPKTGTNKEFNAENQILEWIGKEGLFEEHINDFAEAAEDGRIEFYLDNDEQLIIK